MSIPNDDGVSRHRRHALAGYHLECRLDSHGETETPAQTKHPGSASDAARGVDLHEVRTIGARAPVERGGENGSGAAVVS
jgi:hypothetical protein